MKPFLQKSRLRSTFSVAVVMLCAFAATWVRAVADSENGETIELTQRDLFGIPGWQHRNISIGGFALGMTRSQAGQLAQSRGWVLRPDSPPKKAGALKGPCVEASCGVHEAKGNWVGLNLYFDAADHIRMIKVSFPADADPQVKRINIVRQFKGVTRDFFADYSDDLRNRVLGPIEGKTRESAQTAPFAYIEYDYPNLGLSVHATINRNDKPAKPFDVEVDFMRHE